MPERPRLNHFIDGRAVGPSADQWIDNVEPATGAVSHGLARGNAADVDRAVRAAKAAAAAWSGTDLLERADLLDRVADTLEDRLEEFARAESADQGKPLGLARSVDIPRAVANFRFFAGAARYAQTDFSRTGSAINYTSRAPVGVAGLITPWNLPLYLLTWKTAPALVMGNAVVAKPSELTPVTATMLSELLFEVGLPAGVFNLVHGHGHEVGQALVAHPDVGAISFTGGTVTGRTVAATAAPVFKKLSLELGGKNPTVVFGDADFDAAVDGARRAAFTNQGEICLCGSRLLVERDLHDRFVEAFVERVRELRVGDPLEESTQVGALITAAHRDKVRGYVDLARQEGGQVVCGGVTPEVGGRCAGGFFHAPTVIAGLAPDARCATEEIFGPVVTIHAFENEDEAIGLANASRYGLSASVWTTDLRRAHRVSERLHCGMVWVNTWLLRDLRVPFGGVKDSGVGREGGRWSMEFFSESKNVCIELGPPVHGKEST